jgi:hypothetical protein
MYLEGLGKFMNNLSLDVPGRPIRKTMKNLSLNVPRRAKENHEDLPEYYYLNIIHILTTNNVLLCRPYRTPVSHRYKSVCKICGKRSVGIVTSLRTILTNLLSLWAEAARSSPSI